jgi:hypothetical protein
MRSAPAASIASSSAQGQQAARRLCRHASHCPPRIGRLDEIVHVARLIAVKKGIHGNLDQAGKVSDSAL